MQNKHLSIRRSMAVEQTQEVYERLYGDQPSKASYNFLSAAELEALAERMTQQLRCETDRVAVLGYN
jgi:hypothetical protein